jgi:hypothetical protein
MSVNQIAQWQIPENHYLEFLVKLKSIFSTKYENSYMYDVFENSLKYLKDFNIEL